MRRRDLIGGAGLAAISFVICMEVQRASARPPIDQTNVNRTIQTTVDRTTKGDRLQTRPSVLVPQAELLDGCESSYSATRKFEAGYIVRLCQT
jgi:hypothetical protein